jgi:hypothetical protein
MKRKTVYLADLIVLVAGAVWAQQNAAAPGTATTTCTFDDGKEISVRYYKKVKASEKLPTGKLWTPGNKPMYLFTQTDLNIGDTTLAPGAYALYLMPEKDNWTLIVNRDVDRGQPYDEKQDVVRTTLQLGQLSQPQPFQLVFGHVGPKHCTLRVYLGNIGTWAELREK